MGQFFSSGAVINKGWEKIFRLSSVIFNEICEDLRLPLDKKRCFGLHEHAINPDNFSCVNDQRIRIQFLCESEYFLNPKNFCCGVNVAYVY